MMANKNCYLFGLGIFTVFVFASIMVFSSTLRAQTTWDTQFESKPAFVDFFDVQFVDSLTGWAVGEDGVILFSNNAGQTWFPVKKVVEADLYGLHFISATKGWVAGDNGVVLRTSDSGLSWSRQSTGSTASLRAVYFVNDQQGVAAGSGGKILFTQDGGATWNSQVIGSKTLIKIHFSDANTGWIVGKGGTLLRSDDGGQTWNAKSSGVTEDLHDVFFIDSQRGLIIGDSFQGGTVRMTNDGGQSWQSVSTGVNRFLGLYGIFFLNENNGWIVGTNSVKTGVGTFTLTGYIVLFTQDGGNSWTVRKETTSTNFFGQYITSPLYDVHYTSPSDGIAVGTSGKILRTNDGGTEWNAVDKSINLASVSFADSLNGLAAGSFGTIMRTTDGGSQWEYLTSGVSVGLSGISFLDAMHAWAVGKSGVMITTDDGGQTWRTRASSTDVHLNAIQFLNQTTGWAIGADGTILYTDDGGESWNTQASNSTLDLFDLFFLSENEGWICGEKELVLHTNDGGATWKNQPVSSGANFPGKLSSIYFVNAYEGWAVGSGKVFHTSDGGITWRVQQASFGGTDVLFATPTTGWMAAGGIWQTIDGGQTWEKQAASASISVAALSNFRDTSFWAVGNGPVILRGTDADLEKPFAYFVIKPPVVRAGESFTADASGSGDIQDDPSTLEVRWDWENDGVFDTPFTTEKIAMHQFSEPGTKIIHLEVKDSDGFTADIRRSVLVSRLGKMNPRLNAINVERNASITVSFGVQVDEATVNDSTFIVRGEQSGLHSGTITSGGTDSFQFDPEGDFAYGELVTVTLTEGVESTTGEAIGPFVWSFTTEVSPLSNGDFGLPEAYPGETFLRNPACADLNGDGAIDLVGTSSSKLHIMLNRGDGTFNEQAIQPVYSFLRFLGINDLDGDFDQDIVLMNRDSLTFFMNTGDGSLFERKDAALTDYSNTIGSARLLSLMDVDGDGDMDFALQNIQDDSLYFLINDGSGIFKYRSGIGFGFDFASIFSADFDADGDNDMAIVGRRNRYNSNDLVDSLVVMINNGGGHYSKFQRLETGNAPKKVIGKDLNNDGAVDLVVLIESSSFATQYGDTSRVAVYLNSGQGTFFLKEEHKGKWQDGPWLTDIDGDNDYDILTIKNQPVRFRVFRNNGQTQLSQFTEFRISPGEMCVADFDGDGDMDLGTRIGIMKNGNGAPRATFSFEPATGDTTITFSFNSADVEDNKDEPDSLKLRWDWEGDGVFDTEYSTTKLAGHRYTSLGEKSPVVEILDSDGNTSSFSVLLSVIGDFGDAAPSQRLTAEQYRARSPAWSPDGQWLVFTSSNFVSGLKGLWIVSRDGQTYRQLTDNSTDGEPAWSPDGSKIAFSSRRVRGFNNDIWLVPAEGGEPQQLTSDPASDNSPTWSPDGLKIAFTSSRAGFTPNIWIIPSTGGTATQLTTDSGRKSSPSWSPDGAWIAYSHSKGSLRDQNIWVISVNGDSTYQVTDDLFADSGPIWSPSGEFISYSSSRPGRRQDIFVIPSNGGPSTKIIGSVADDWRPAWSPDGKQIAFTSDRRGRDDIWIVDISAKPIVDFIFSPSAGDENTLFKFDASGSRVINGSGSPFSFRWDWESDGVFDTEYSSSPQASYRFPGPGKVRVTLEAKTQDNQRGAAAHELEILHRQDLFVAREIETTLSQVFEPTWSPDGSKIAFSVPEGRDTWNIWVMPATGGDPIQITKDPNEDRQPAWSPDGTRIAFSSNRSGNWDIWVVPDTGGVAIQLTDDPNRVKSPSWSPDGSQIVFSSHKKNNGSFSAARLWIIPAEGGMAQEIPLASSFRHSSYEEPAWSPLGDQIAYSWNENIWSISPAGGTPKRLTEDPFDQYEAYNPTWSPDGQTIAFVYDLIIRTESGEQTRSMIWRLPSSGGVPSQLTGLSERTREPAWSPDGKTIAFTRRYGDLWVMDLETTVFVELAQFAATVNSNNVELTWQTTSETDNDGFEIQRGRDNATFHQIGFVEGQGTMMAVKTYSFIDRNLATGKYYYRLRQIDFDGSSHASAAIEVTVGSPSHFALHQNYPNPFNPETTIKYQLPKTTKVKLTIYNLLGQQVATLVDRQQPAGYYSVKWHGRDQFGNSIASGVYLYRLEAAEFAKVRKLTLMR